jgi:four helix bundle protein
MGESHRDLVVWKKSMALVTAVYAATRGFPRDESYGLTNQIRRAAVSVPSNIAEGKGRISKREYLQFLSTSRGSLLELECQLEIAHNLGYLDDSTFGPLSAQTSEVGRILNGLISAIRKRLRPPVPESDT